MVFGAAIATGFGILGGLTAGSYVFANGAEPKSFKYLHHAADSDDTVEYPKVINSVPSNMRDLLPFTPSWLSWPDYDKVTMVNRITAIMWPHLDKAIMQQVIEQTKPVLEQVKQQVPGGLLDGIIFDTENFTLGTIPLRVGGIKVYSTSDDECIMESSVYWGSNSRFFVEARLRVGPALIKVPVQVSNIQMTGRARVTFKPLVETIPCLGGLTISLLEIPHVDMDLKLVKQVDMMAVPGIKEAVKVAVKMMLDGMMVYPNSMSFPIMENYGVPPPPKGTLQVTVVSVNLNDSGGLFNKIVPYVKCEVREGRGMRTKSVKGNIAMFHEPMNLVVDDPLTQQLRIHVKDDDMGWEDPLLGMGTVMLATSKFDAKEGKDVGVEEHFIRNPKKEVERVVELYKPKGPGMLLAGVSTLAKVGSLGIYKGASSKANASQETVGTATVRLRFIPFTQPTLDDEDEDDEAALKAAAATAAAAAPTRSVNARVHANLKGVLTVKVIRCVDLGNEGVDAYVVMRLVDPDANVADVVQQTKVVFNEQSPRYGQKFDFVMIPAMSTLQLTIMDKTTAMESMMSLKITKRFEDKQLGKLNIAVADVARNGRLRDTFTLSEAEKGSIELLMDWHTCHFSE